MEHPAGIEQNTGEAYQPKPGHDPDKKADPVPEGGGINDNKSRERKSVRWSQELVTESMNYPSVGGGSNNPYVAYAPAQSNPPSFNIKSMYYFVYIV